MSQTEKSHPPEDLHESSQQNRKIREEETHGAGAEGELKPPVGNKAEPCRNKKRRLAPI